MLKKIIHIQSVGKFKKYHAQGDVQLRVLNLIYGDNGRGKTTLVAILRSLAENEPNHILERKTIDSDELIKVTVLTEHGISNFVNEKEWDRILPNIEIFDSTYVNENVYSGDVVVHDHKKNLYYFIVGSTGVQLAEKIEQLDSKSRENTGTIKDKKIEIEEKIAWEGTLDALIELPEIDNIDEKIKTVRNHVKILEESAKIQERSLLSSISLPEFPSDNFKVLLIKTLDDIARDAETRLKEHISYCMDDQGETWIQSGLAYIPKDSSCPFCGQPLNDLELIKSYQDYFSVSYSNLKRELKGMRQMVNNYFSQENLLAVQKAFDENNALTEIWGELVQIEGPETNFGSFVESWNTAHNELTNLLTKKENQPLDDIFQEKEINHALGKVRGMEDSISSNNVWISGANRIVEEFKNNVQIGDLDAEIEQLKKLEATKVRYSKDISPLCNEYLTLLGNREQLLTDKEVAKKELRDFAETFLSDCLSSTNRYLEKFGTDVRLDNMKPSFAGGKPSAAYSLLLDEVSVNLGSASTTGEPSFKNVLSDGDKHSLAFAFFLSRLEHDQDIGDKIVIFDDPITSFGISRKNSTQQEILKVAKKAKQVIVLSHDQLFLKMIWDNAHKAKTLQIPRKGKGSSIEEWDIASATQSEYFKGYFDLKGYLEGNEVDARSVVRCIRPVLEGNLRVRFPSEFLPNEWLGDYIDKIKSAEAGENLFVLKKNLDEISDINNYSKKYHHQQNPKADSEPINETELETFIKRTLKVISS